MSQIPTNLSESEFEVYVLPYLKTARRGFVSSIPLYKIFNYILYKLHTGCQWYKLPIERDVENPERKEISYKSVHHHYSKWCKAGCFFRLWRSTILAVQHLLDLSEIKVDGTHTVAKRGGGAVAYQGRKKAKTTNIIPFTDKNGYIIASTGLIAGNHNDNYNLKENLQSAFKFMKRLGLDIRGAYFNGDKAFDTKDARKTCFNHGLYPNIPENKRNRKKPKRGRKRLHNKEVYKNRYVIERSFAWVDKFRSVLVRYDVREEHFLGANHLAFAMINLRSVL